MSMALKSQRIELVEFPMDVSISGAAVILLLIGFVMVGSASTEVAERTYGDPLYLFARHGIYVFISLGFGAMALMIPISFWQKVDWILLLLSFALLIVVLIPGIGKTVNGSTRWISLGFFTVQGSEFVKLFSIVYIAGYLVRHKEKMHDSIASFAKPLALILLIVLLLLEQPDFGASVVIMASVMGIIFLSGVPFRHFLPLITLFVVATFVVARWQPYRLERFASFANPWEHQFDGGYQLTQALIAFGRGEWFGLGLGNSIQKLFFLPEAHTDFLFSIIAEEMGIFGAVLVIVAFFVIVYRGLIIGRKAQASSKDFHAYLAYGIALLLGIQSAINIGVNVGLLPTKGLTLPFLSYGGNSLIISCVLIAILLRIEFECRIESLPRQRKIAGSRLHDK
ncbi:MAG: putative lipid II flippase FtsW [Pseudomonadales bacterium]|nr:putative lipid II flippase FtsW [Pseudomonadales bacterium]